MTAGPWWKPSCVSLEDDAVTRTLIPRTRAAAAAAMATRACPPSSREPHPSFVRRPGRTELWRIDQSQDAANWQRQNGVSCNYVIFISRSGGQLCEEVWKTVCCLPLRPGQSCEKHGRPASILHPAVQAPDDNSGDFL